MVLLTSGNIAFATSSRLVLYDENPVTYDQTVTDTFEDGGTYPLDLQLQHHAYTESDLSSSFGSHGYLYILNATGTRELVSPIGGNDGNDPFLFPRAGQYELDIYDVPPPILMYHSWLDSVIDNLFHTQIANAQTSDPLLETIHFTITDKNAVQDCCSSVAFLPGIKGSILKKNEKTLWPPSVWSNDVNELALSTNGSSEPGIYVDGILNSFYTMPVYAQFTAFMDSLVLNGTISEWKPLAYDWRFSPEQILDDGIQTASGTVDMITQIEDLAAHSQTGKVTIVAHSMGGLMGKAIIKRLQEKGEDNLVDSFVMVGTPQLGTPQAIAAMLHGDGESIEPVFGLLSFVNRADARESAQNMQSSYNLLPSKMYFSQVDDPVISFDDNAYFADAWKAEWGPTLDSYAEYSSFVTGKEVPRVNPEPSQILTPEVLSTDLFTKAESWHDTYDSFTFPSSINVVQIAGWGDKTLKGIEYQMGHLGEPSYSAVFTGEGDGTVAYPSAVSADNANTYYFNSNQYRIDTGNIIEHKDLMSAAPIQNVLLSIFEKGNVQTSDTILTTKPIVAEVGKQLIISTHSPVVLGVYDDQGNFTGIEPQQNLSGDFYAITKNIPQSSFRAYGDSQYIFLPATGSYRVVYHGTDNGLTTVDIDIFDNDVQTPFLKYTDIPTTDKTIATFTVDSTDISDTNISLDSNGDGAQDTVVYADGYTPSTAQLIAELKQQINSLTLSKFSKRSLLSKVAILERLLQLKNDKVKTKLVDIDIRILEAEVKLLQKNGQLTFEESNSLLVILDKIKL